MWMVLSWLPVVWDIGAHHAAASSRPGSGSAVPVLRLRLDEGTERESLVLHERITTKPSLKTRQSLRASGQIPRLLP